MTSHLRGIRIHLATPRLRGLLALTMAAAAAAMVLVNSVMLVRGTLDNLQPRVWISTNEV
ncbi:hypothetical protein FLP41_01510 (plasmid) [Paracoccus marcusii]|uniref:hypothetical protein n=1 Tax=Paracoccus marcusii TaxID=59779 RepID=UPI002ED24569|nr:hypothetical protein FLP41_01510 [Paracoccus marcusii]